MVVGAALAAAFALTGCAPAGYNAADGGTVAEPAANAVDETPSAEAEDETGADDATDDSGDAADEAGDDAAGKGAAGETVEVPEDEVTDSLTGTSVKRMGQVVVNGDGFVFYRFDKDTAKPKSKSTCNGDCAKVWPPALTNDGKPKLKGVDEDLVGTVTRDDGSKQLTIGGWPIYLYIGDKKPGTWTGQNVGGTWFVIKPDGTKNLTCLPKISKPVAPPKDDSDSADSEDSSGDAGSAGSDYSY
jgi:predicted lipoprotein with Yx(FWY)xxD motif